MEQQAQAPKEFKVQEQVLVAVINYLATKPYKETTDLIGALQKSEPIAPIAPSQTVRPKMKPVKVAEKSPKEKKE
jgi:hypothetical protein